MTVAVAGLLLAAGAGRRYGMPKALVVHDGLLLVERGAAALRDGGCDPVVVVLGAEAATVQERAALTRCVVVLNPDWESGMGSSLRAGLAAVEAVPADAVAVLLVDTPGITADAVARVLTHAGGDASTSHDVLAVATYDGAPGHPVLLGRRHWAGVAELAVGEAGARAYLVGQAATICVVPCDDIADGTDVDHVPEASGGTGSIRA